MVEVKADALEESFEQFEDDGAAALKAELDVLKGEDRLGRHSGAAAGTGWGQVA